MELKYQSVTAALFSYIKEQLHLSSPTVNLLLVIQDYFNCLSGRCWQVQLLMESQYEESIPLIWH